MKLDWQEYWRLWIIITGGLVLFLVAAPFLPAKWERIELPTIQEADALPSPKEIILVKVPPPLISRKGDSSSVQAAPPSQAKKEVILLIGDSMIEWLRLRLASWCKEAGHELYTVIWPSSNLIWWGQTDTLLSFIRAYRPTYILISLGSNELFVKNLQRRMAYFNRIMEMVGSIPVVWIGPPAWREDEGIIDSLRNRMGPGRYFSSERLIMQRISDGAHPTPREAYRWADTLVAYLRDSALYPINFPLQPPSKLTALPAKTHLLAPHAP
ncbi:MAG: SGNH/GDSL hydrolase family protein [Bacteroidia bacterium]|nr:SGNH/GDSL hydrolase family protein [Bacteroidia bacterium]MDW8057388.1 SGNH/GDSL hydrolase family protein [Bacteroidia bacterium]